MKSAAKIKTHQTSQSRAAANNVSQKSGDIRTISNTEPGHGYTGSRPKILQRAVLKDSNDMDSICSSLQQIKNNIILQAPQGVDLGRIAEFLEMKNVSNALDVIREADKPISLQSIINKFVKLSRRKVTVKAGKKLVKKLDRLKSMVLSEENTGILKYNMKMNQYIETEEQKIEKRRKERERLEIDELKKKYGQYSTVFRHVFKGDFNGSTPTGYHSTKGDSSTHAAYGTKTNLSNGVYQQSVKGKKSGSNSFTKKPLQSTFFPDNASMEDVKLAITSGMSRLSKQVKYPIELNHIKLTVIGGSSGTIFPSGGTNKNAEDLD